MSASPFNVHRPLPAAQVTTGSAVSGPPEPSLRPAPQVDIEHPRGGAAGGEEGA